MLQCNIFPGLPPDFLDSEVNLFLVPFMDSEAESENPPRAGALACPGHLARGGSLPWRGVTGTPRSCAGAGMLFQASVLEWGRCRADRAGDPLPALCP